MNSMTREFRLAPPNVYAKPWIGYWPGARNAPTEG
jgi:hypothetical protein